MYKQSQAPNGAQVFFTVPKIKDTVIFVTNEVKGKRSIQFKGKRRSITHELIISRDTYNNNDCST